MTDIPVEWVAPVITGVFLLVIAIVTGVIAWRKDHQTQEAAHEPTTAEAWAEAQRARESEARAWRHSHRWEDLFYLMRGALKGYARRMQDLFGEEPAALSVKEKKALEATTPEMDDAK